MSTPVPPTFGLILAGGRGRRMGGSHKPFAELDGRPLIERVADIAGSQCAGLAIAGPLADERLRLFGLRRGLPVLPDVLPDHQGPLAGLLAGLDHCAISHPTIEWLASFAADSPFLPGDLVARLHEGRRAAGGAGAMAASRGRVHPVIALWPVAARHRLRRRLDDGLRKVGLFADELAMARTPIDGAGFDPFFNVNTPGELCRAEALLGAAIGPIARGGRDS